MKTFLNSLLALAALLMLSGASHAQSTQQGAVATFTIQFYDSTLSTNGTSLTSSAIDTVAATKQTFISDWLFIPAEWDTARFTAAPATGDTSTFKLMYEYGSGTRKDGITALGTSTTTGDTLKQGLTNAAISRNLIPLLGSTGQWVRLKIQFGPWALAPVNQPTQGMLVAKRHFTMTLRRRE